MIAPERLATVPVHFVASAEQVRRQCRLVQVDIIRRLALLIQLWTALTRHTTTITRLVTAKRLALANQEDFTSTLLNRMVRRNDPSHPNECFPPHHLRHQAVIIIYTRMVETLHRLHHLPIKSIIVADEIAQWLPGQLRCHATNSRWNTALVFALKAEGKPVGHFLFLQTTVGIYKAFLHLTGIGVYISRIEEASVAERSGLRPGDTILEVNGTPFSGMTHDEALAVNEMSFASLRLVHVECVGRWAGAWGNGRVHVKKEDWNIDPCDLNGSICKTVK